MMVTPRKIEYAREKEQGLFESLNSLASIKQEELKQLIHNTIEANRESILNASKGHTFTDIELVPCVHESIDIVDVSGDDVHFETINSSKFTVKCARDYKKCTNQIQKLVINTINVTIGQKLTESVQILKENYIGTLRRCLKSLEDLNIGQSSSDPNSASVSQALQQILNASYQFDINITGSSSLISILIHKMKEVIHFNFKALIKN